VACLGLLEAFVQRAPGDCEPNAIVSNAFMIEWPPKSGQQMAFPEIDRAGFFDVDAAKRKMKTVQEGLIEEILRLTDPS
jgi:predicted NUDIX family NTP pyrophosphohydrolase